MNRLAIELIAAALVAIAAFFFGMEWRDRSCDVDTSKRDATDARAETKVHAKARTDDLQQNASSAAVSTVAAKRESAQTQHERIITREVITYAQNPSARDACGDADFLRIWNSANEGPRAFELDGEPGSVGAGERASSPAAVK